MTRFGWMVVGGIVCVLAAIVTVVVWYQMHFRARTPVETVATSTPTITDPSALAIYTNGTYGFSFFYPAHGILTDDFTASSSEQLPWRLGATAPGTLVTQVETSEGEARIGMSSEERERAACTKVGPAEKSLGSFTVGSTTWSQFSFTKLGTEDERSVTSYRTIHKGQCVAVETLERAGETASSTPFTLQDLAHSFTFAS